MKTKNRLHLYGLPLLMAGEALVGATAPANAADK
jgi:hypothetical protein